METKHLNATIKAAKNSGEFEAILSMPTLDRDNEIVVAKALDPLPDRITIDIDHGLSVATTVGSGVPYYDGDVLKLKGKFASTALGQEVRTLVTEGHIGHMSVAMGFVEKDMRDGVGYITKGTLLNAAIVGIPANLDAAILTSKSHVPEHLLEVIKSAVREVLDERRTTVKDILRHPSLLNADAVRAIEGFASIGDAVTKSADTESPAGTAAEAAVPAGAEVDVARALAAIAAAEAELAL